MRTSHALFASLPLTLALSAQHNAQKYATWLNFGDDLLDGHDGLPTHPTQPFKYGQPLYPITTDGDGREQFEGHITYYEGKYWLHAATWDAVLSTCGLQYHPE